MEEVVSPANMQEAYKRVCGNNCSAGVDGIGVEVDPPVSEGRHGVMKQYMSTCLAEIEQRLQFKFTENSVKMFSGSSPKYHLEKNLYSPTRGEI